MSNSTVRDFYKSNKKAIYDYMQDILHVKHSIKLKNGYLNSNKSDLYTFIRHTRNLKYVLRWHDIYRNKRVIDIGAGLGGCYLPLRFSQPAELIAVEPNNENYEFLIKHIPYDKIIQSRWQEFTYKKGDCVFLKDPWVSDWKRLFDRLSDYDVSDIIIILDFIDDENPKAKYINREKGDIVTPHRFTSDMKIDVFQTPSIGFINQIINQNGYSFSSNDLYENPLKDQGKKIRRLNLHIQKDQGTS